MAIALPALVLLAVGGSQETVDLLSLVDPVKGASGGTWTRTPEGLVSPGKPFARVSVPYAPPEEYDVTLVAERLGDSNSVNLGLAVGDIQFLVILDAFLGGEFLSGIELIDGKAFMSNETTVKGAFFAKGVPSTVVCAVRKERITVSVDGRKAIDWKADFRRLSLMQGWSVPHKNGMLLGSWTSVVRIRRLELLPVRGAGRRLEEPAPAPPPLENLPPGEIDARLRPLLERLDSDTFAVRNAAQAELELLPVRWMPRIAALAEERQSEEVRFRLTLLGVSPAWSKLLRGSIRDARQTLRMLDQSGGNREVARLRVVADALELTPQEAGAAFAGFLDAKSPALQDLGLAGLAVLPGPASARAADFLGIPERASLAADVLLAAGDPRVVPKVLEQFRAGASLHAARVLEHLDPAAAVDDALALARKAGVPSRPALQLLGQAGRGDLLAELLEEATPSSRDEIARAVARAAAPGAVAALRASFGKSDRPGLRNELLRSLRDPAWAVEAVLDALQDPGTLNEHELNVAAAAAGPELRGLLRRELAKPGLKVSVRRKLLPVLAVAGTAEDGALLVAALADPRLARAAAEGLDRLGDPAAAAPLLGAWKRSESELPLGPVLAAPPGDALEADLAEILADPDGYENKWFAALRLAAPRWSPRLRGALAAGVAATGSFDWRGARLAALRALAGTVTELDDPRIAALRAHGEPGVRQCGLLLATVRGDAAAPAELALALAGELRPAPYKPFGSDRLSLMDLPGPASWKDAVAAEWNRRPGWDDGAAWLAVRGDARARAHVAARIDALPDGLRRWLDANLGAQGDVDALRRLLGRVLAGVLPAPEEEAAFAAAAPPELRQRVLARARLLVRHGNEPLLRLAALTADSSGIPFLRQALSDRELRGVFHDRTNAQLIASLGRLQARAAIPDLRRCLRWPDPACRAAAARALAEIGDRASIPWITRLVDDPFPEDERTAPGEAARRVWHAAIDALEKLAGVPTEGRVMAERRAFWRDRHAAGK